MNPDSHRALQCANDAHLRETPGWTQAPGRKPRATLQDDMHGPRRIARFASFRRTVQT
jgi:hypothetical protein